MVPRIAMLTVLCAIVCQTCLAKPAEVVQNPLRLSLPRQLEAIPVVDENKREQRSPQFGFPKEEFPDPEARFGEERHLKFHKHHHHKPSGYGEYPGFAPPAYPPSYPEPVPAYPPPPVYPEPLPAYPPPPAYPPSAGYPSQGGAGGSFATASAGSIDLNGKPTGGQSQANAQSASFNFGPYSASFSVAEASSGGQKFYDV